jgi:hypothetical protein
VKKIISSLVFASGFLSLAPSAFAANGSSLCPAQFSAICTNLEPFNLLGAFIGFIFTLSIVVALLYLIWGGFKWLTSGGDKTAVGAAREHIIAAIIGLVVIFLSYFILNIALNFFLGTGLNGIEFKSLTGSSSSPTCTAPRHLCTVDGTSICCAGNKTCGGTTANGARVPKCI